jgi:hypothetical protein
MVAQNHTFEAGGYRYVLTHAKARETLQVCARLGNAGAALFSGMSHGQGGARLANAITFLLSSPDLGPTLDFVVSTFAPYTQIVDQATGNTASLKDCVDAHFAGRMTDFGKWIEEAVEFECGDFLGEMVERFVAALAAQIKGSSASLGQKAVETSASSGG